MGGNRSGKRKNLFLLVAGFLLTTGVLTWLLVRQSKDRDDTPRSITIQSPVEGDPSDGGRLIVVNSFCQKISPDAPPRFIVHLRSTDTQLAHLKKVTLNGHPLDLKELTVPESKEDFKLSKDRVPKLGFSDKRILWYDVRPTVSTLGPDGHLEFIVQMATNSNLPVELAFEDSTGATATSRVSTEAPFVRISGTGWSADSKRLYVYVENQTNEPFVLLTCTLNVSKIGNHRLELIGFPLRSGTKGFIAIDGVHAGLLDGYCWLEIRGQQETQVATALLRVVPGFVFGPEEDVIDSLGEYAKPIGFDGLTALLQANAQGEDTDSKRSVCGISCPAHKWGNLRAGAMLLARHSQVLRARVSDVPIYGHVCRTGILDVIPRLGNSSDIIRINALSPVSVPWQFSKSAKTIPQDLLTYARRSAEPNIVHAVLPVGNEPPYFIDRIASRAELELLLSYCISAGTRGVLLRKRVARVSDTLWKSLVGPLEVLTKFLEIAEPLGVVESSHPDVGCHTLLLGDLGILVVLINHDNSWNRTRSKEKKFTQPFEFNGKEEITARIKLPKGLAGTEIWSLGKFEESGRGQYSFSSDKNFVDLLIPSLQCAKYVLILSERGKAVLDRTSDVGQLASTAGPLFTASASLASSLPTFTSTSEEARRKRKPKRLQWGPPPEVVGDDELASMFSDLQEYGQIWPRSERRKKVAEVEKRARDIIKSENDDNRLLWAFEALFRAQEIAGNITARREDFRKYLSVLKKISGKEVAIQRAMGEVGKFRKKRAIAEALEYNQFALELTQKTDESRAFLLLQRGRLQRYIGDHKSAIKGFRTVTDDFPNSRFSLEARLELAQTYFLVHLDKKGDRILDQLLASKIGDDIAIRVLKMKIKYARAHSRNLEAAKYLGELKQRFPHDPEVKRALKDGGQIINKALDDLDSDL